MPGQGGRTVSVRVAGAGERGVSPGGPDRQLAAALLEASPRVSIAGPCLCRADARGWGRRGGEEALARALREAAEKAGFSGVRVGIADVAVAADAAAVLAAGGPGVVLPVGGSGVILPADRSGAAMPTGSSGMASLGETAELTAEGALIVLPGGDRVFLAHLPLALLPVSEELRRTFRALGFLYIGEIAALERSELEFRFGSDGVQAHRWARGEDDRMFLPLPLEELPEARLELDGPVTELEPLLFVLRHLLARVCTDLAEEGKCAARLVLELAPEVRTSRSRPQRPAPGRIPIVPARPTAREDLLFDLCRAVLERELSGDKFLSGSVVGLALQVTRTAPAGARQGDLFARGWRDPLEAAAALSRLRARLGEKGVVWPAPRASHRPETRNRWVPVRSGVSRPEDGDGGCITEAVPQPTATGATFVAEYATEKICAGESAAGGQHLTPALPPVLRLLPRPAPVGVRAENGWPAEVWDETGRREVTTVEGPERLSGDWWEMPYRREYYRVCTSAGELLWLFRARDRGGKDRWWLHGWWD